MEHDITQIGDLDYKCTCGKSFVDAEHANKHADDENFELHELAKEAGSKPPSPENTISAKTEKPKRGRPLKAKKTFEKASTAVAPYQQSASGNKVSLQTYLRSGAVQERISELLKDRSGDFTTSLMTAVNSNAVLQDCEPASVVTAALTAASMNLPINSSLGFAHIVPYYEAVKDANGRKVGQTRKAQYQIGWKGFVQLAQRTGQYKTLNVDDVREGEYKGIDRLSGTIKFEWVEDKQKRDKLPVIGYFAYFKLKEGFEKILYMTNEELTAHGKRYSQSFKKGYGLWVDNFSAMSQKTVVKLLVGKYGPMSTELQRAIMSDQAVVGAEDNYDYIDNKSAPKDKVDEGEIVDKESNNEAA